MRTVTEPGRSASEPGVRPVDQPASASALARRWEQRLKRVTERPLVIDLVVIAAVAWLTGMDAWWNEEGTRQADGLTWALWAASIGALVLRRRWPLAAAAGCGAALSGWYLLGHHGELLNLPTIVALYAVAVSGDRRRSIVVAVVAAAWSGVLGFTSDDPLGARGGSPVLEMLWPLVPIVWGEAVRTRRELEAHAEREREHEAARRVEVERRRIAQEFHDVVAHTMSAVNVQVGVAVAAFETRPDVARDALVRARASTRAALDELRASVALLRSGEHEPLAPAPRLDAVDGLAEVVRAAGIDVTVDTDLDAIECSGSVELAGYRIVQEALTNVVRHSGASRASVSIRPADEHTLAIEVVDDGCGPTPTGAAGATGAPGGFGLNGMAERAAAVGGTVERGPGEGGGFRVRAVLPCGPKAR
ncbi:MAG: histidine kinase [Actinomycetota bacterium]|nr:histidine kinase [Actinomycetota bacterium]